MQRRYRPTNKSADFVPCILRVELSTAGATLPLQLTFSVGVIAVYINNPLLPSGQTPHE